MDLQLSHDQRLLLDSVHSIVQRHGASLGEAEPFDYDPEFEQLIADLGLLDDDIRDAPLLDRVLAVEGLAHSRATADHAARLALAPWTPAAERTAVVVGGGVPTRHGATATRLVGFTPGDARTAAVEVTEGPVEIRYGFPYRTVPQPSGARLPFEQALSAWRLAIVAELCGCLSAGLAMTIDHVKTRVQFGRPLGAIQTIQQAVTKCHVDIESARHLLWAAASTGEHRLARLATYRGIDAAATAVATLHQCTGAIGLTRAHALHTWTMRGRALAFELRALQPLDS